jgi:hypothetical protein
VIALAVDQRRAGAGPWDPIDIVADSDCLAAPLIVIQRHLGHSNLGITSIDLQGIDNAEIIDAVHARHAPIVPVSASLSP